MQNTRNYIKVLSKYKFEIWHSIHTKYNKWNQYVINFFSQAKIHKFSKIYILYIPFIYIYVCVQTEKAMAPHSRTLSWRIPWMEEPGGLPSMASQSQTRLKRLSSSSSSMQKLFYYAWYRLEKEQQQKRERNWKT